jgi:mono/diheme cytochrome c family protein
MPLSFGRAIRVAAIVIFAVLAFVFVRTHRAGGQAFPQDVASDVALGRNLAEAWCMECHAVERHLRIARPGPSAPDFAAIANRPGTTALSIKTFLRSEHETMPHFVIQPRDADVLAAYILSLRRR